ncbi:glycosyltransferase [Thiovibrio sp. JS02]
MRSVDICIITFKRPQSLARLLAGLSRLTLSPEETVRIIVVDNDREATARVVVDRARRNMVLPIIYDVEPIQNIALARNRGLVHVQAEFVAFIDDDEEPSALWLKELLSSACRFQADVVLGPVVSCFPEDVASWIKEGGFFDRQRFLTGTPRDDGGTGNALIRAALFKALVFRFDPEFGRTGGSDSELLHRLHVAGKKIIWCDEAEVREYIEADRLSLCWLMRRAFRCGQGYYRILVAGKNPWWKGMWFLAMLRNLLIALLRLVVSPFAGQVAVISALRGLANLLGMLSAPWGRWFKEYE